MNLNNIKPAAGSTFNSKRIGRGQGSGKGGTSTKGHKGQKSRSGYSQKIGFEGGQMPIHMRLPKLKGFKNPNHVEYQVVNVADLAEKFADGGDITVADIAAAGLVRANQPVKVLGSGDINVKLNVTADKFSKSAVEKIEAAGGSANTK